MFCAVLTLCRACVYACVFVVLDVRRVQQCVCRCVGARGCVKCGCARVCVCVCVCFELVNTVAQLYCDVLCCPVPSSLLVCCGMIASVLVRLSVTRLGFAVHMC